MHNRNAQIEKCWLEPEHCVNATRKVLEYSRNANVCKCNQKSACIKRIRIQTCVNARNNVNTRNNVNARIKQGIMLIHARSAGKEMQWKCNA